MHLIFTATLRDNTIIIHICLTKGFPETLNKLFKVLHYLVISWELYQGSLASETSTILNSLIFKEIFF